MKFDLTNTKIRYLVGGTWNAVFGSIVFAAVWWLLGTTLSIWAVTLIAHTIATAHAFFVQRQYVFAQSAGRVWPQLVRFQFAYVCIGVLTAFFIAALQVQGLHPILAQLLSVVLVALGGYFAGENFTFNRDAGNFLETLLPRLANRIWRLRGAVAFFAISMFLFDYAWGAHFYLGRTNVGHDFSFSALALLEGKNWMAANGFVAALFNPPWFTPAWCAGAAFFADPQSSFYSPIQFLAFIVDPMRASYFSVLLFAAVAFWGSFALARIVFGWRESAAVVFAVLGAANAFVPLRSAVGETAYQSLYIWTLLTLALCWPGKCVGPRAVAWPGLGVGLCLTAWLQFGFAGMMIPAFLASLALCLVMVLRGRAELSLVISRTGVGVLIALLLNASRLYEGANLLKNFPRDFYLMPGFVSLYDAAMATIYALIQPSEWTANFGLRKLVNTQFSAFPHEWALNFGLGAALAFVCVGVISRPWALLTSSRINWKEVRVSHWIALFSLILVVSLPFVLLWADGSLRAIIKTMPILSSTTWPMRWIVILLPLLQMLLALPLQLLPTTYDRRWMWAIAILASGAIWVGPVTEPLAYYFDPRMQSYDPRPVTEAFERLRTEGPMPIGRIRRADDNVLTQDRNDAMFVGESEASCYNPIYGYRLEAFPQLERLRSGPVLADDSNGQSLILNPACLVHPAANACTPGDGFRINDRAQLAQAELFLNRHPFEWKRPVLGRALAVVSQASFWLLFTLLAIRSFLTLVGRR